LAVDVSEHQVETFVRKRSGDTQADPTGGAGDDGHATSKHLH
jgi:hypothetical protein